MSTPRISKKEYYQARALSYPMIDPEAEIRYIRLLRWIDVDTGPVVYEVGCKFAVLRDLIVAHGHENNAHYRGVDIDLATLEKIPRYNPQTFLCHDVNEGIPFDDNTCDYLICLEVLEHLENATFFLAEARRVLKPNGRLIISVPNPYCWSELWGNLRSYPDTEGHVASYTFQNMDALVRFGGMRIIDAMGTFTRIPFSRRITGQTRRFLTSSMLLTRSYMYLISKQS